MLNEQREMTSRIPIFVISTLLVASGCTITQTGNPVARRDADPREMCVVQDPHVNDTFLPAYAAALGGKGFSTKLLEPGAPLTACPLTSTYYARWSWDFVAYMSHAKIVVYRDGAEVGNALYDAPKAGWGMTTRIYESTESKVATMVDHLFP